jgi:hypothetical protein
MVRQHAVQLRRYSAALVLALAAVVLSFTSAHAQTASSIYFNSSESGCSGSDANVLFCDDFERGFWAKTTADPSLANAGWNMTPYSPAWPDPTGQNYGRCGGAGAAGTNCSADTGQPSSGQGQHGAMGDHALSQKVTELYFRYYVRPSADRQYSSNEKMLTFNANVSSGGIIIGDIGGPGANGMSVKPVYESEIYNVPFRPQNKNCVGGTSTRTDPGNGSLYYPTKSSEPFCANPFLPRAFSTPHWFYIEAYIKLNTPGQANGQFKMWVDDCGTNGVCSGTPTLRSSYGVSGDGTAGLQYVRPTNTCPDGTNPCKLGAIWFENWQNPAVPGSDRYDQIKVSKVGPIGFAGSTGATPPPPAYTSFYPAFSPYSAFSPYTSFSPSTSLPGDLNADGGVNALDLQLEVNVILGTETNSAIRVRADLNGDGPTNALDLQRLVNLVLGQ